MPTICCMAPGCRKQYRLLGLPSFRSGLPDGRGISSCDPTVARDAPTNAGKLVGDFFDEFEAFGISKPASAGYDDFCIFQSNQRFIGFYDSYYARSDLFGLQADVYAYDLPLAEFPFLAFPLPRTHRMPFAAGCWGI